MANTPSSEIPETASAVLAAARTCRLTADQAEAELLQHAATWAAQHSSESVTKADVECLHGTEQDIPVAGVGAPLVVEFCVPEFAAVLGWSTDTGRKYLGEAVELRYRLPRTWARVVAGDLVAWKARRIASATTLLPMAGAAYVDASVAAYAHRIGIAQLDRVIEEAKVRFDPDAAEADRKRAVDGRHFGIHTAQAGFEGTVQVEGLLDLADALDLDAAIAHGATQLGRLGCDETLDVRRSLAAGVLARAQLALDLDTPDSDTPADSSGDEDTPPVVEGVPLRTVAKPPPAGRRQVVLYVHLTADALADRGLARVENTRSFVSADQIRAWCGNPDTQITVKPVIDLNECVRVDAYEIPDRLREQVTLTNPTCVFPWCTRPSRRCDLDHITPYDTGGEPRQTSSDNLAPLCRKHHRTKTHTRWRYTRLAPGTHLWTTPHGYHLRVDHTGSIDISRKFDPESDQGHPPGTGHPPDS